MIELYPGRGLSGKRRLRPVWLAGASLAVVLALGQVKRALLSEKSDGLPKSAILVGGAIGFLTSDLFFRGLAAACMLVGAIATVVKCYYIARDSDDRHRLAELRLRAGDAGRSLSDGSE